jgi:hypothetical protein
MNLQFEFGGSNQGFFATYKSIYEQIDKIYPEVKKTHFEKGLTHCDHPGGRCGISNMVVINRDNNKATVLSFWDRGFDVITGNDWKNGWPDINIVHVIGGLGIDPQLITDKMPKFSPFLYPMEFMRVYDSIEQIRTPYKFTDKIPKACFIGNLYETRKVLSNLLKKRSDLFDIFGSEDGIFNHQYFQKLNEYAISLSFNGNGELCMRDFESIGLGIPVVRSEVKTPLMAPLVPEVDYLRGSDPSENAWFVYGYLQEEKIANQFIERVELALTQPELLEEMSKRNVEYFDENVYPEKIAQKFFEVFDLDILR